MQEYSLSVVAAMAVAATVPAAVAVAAAAAALLLLAPLLLSRPQSLCPAGSSVSVLCTKNTETLNRK